MGAHQRVLDPDFVRGRGLEAARRLGPVGVIECLEASGLRGRGGAGFPTGRKWRTVAGNTSATVPTTVVVNAAEGEPGSFKDRAILRANPHRVVEGALIAATALAADRIVIALKRTFERELALLQAACQEMQVPGISIEVFAGPTEYLFGEESALLEAIEGRAPFPRLAAPFRDGVDVAAPTLVNNTETFANVPGIVAEGPDWFRSVGTDESPGTVVCTVSGRVQRDGVGEFALGTPLREVIEEVSGGALIGHELVAVMSGVANALLPADLLDTPMSYEALAAVGSGLGAAGFLVFDDTTDIAAVAHGVSRFLGVESCGQCEPCKQDGLALAGLLDRVRRSEADEHDLTEIAERTRTVSVEARCFLAQQHELVLDSVLKLFPEALRAHVDGNAPPADAEVITAIVDIVDGRAVLDEHQLNKQPDWTYDETDSGKAPADRIDTRAAH